MELFFLHNLEQKLGYKYTDLNLLELALRHRSVSKQSNERLEFLGDAILNFVIAEALFIKYPDIMEGELSRLRSNLVKRETLTEIAKTFELGDYLLLGPGERKSGGRHRSSILADTVEAIIGSIYLDRGMDEGKKVLLSWYSDRLANLNLENQKDAKSRLQEYMQAHKLALPKYTVVNTIGSSSDPVFYVQCNVVGSPNVTFGEGGSKQDAEQEAAEKFLAELVKQK